MRRGKWEKYIISFFDATQIPSLKIRQILESEKLLLKGKGRDGIEEGGKERRKEKESLGEIWGNLGKRAGERWGGGTLKVVGLERKSLVKS